MTVWELPRARGVDDGQIKKTVDRLVGRHQGHKFFISHQTILKALSDEYGIEKIDLLDTNYNVGVEARMRELGFEETEDGRGYEIN